MVIYLDTSALLKLYIEEEGQVLVEEAVAVATRVATSTVAYAEARAGLARRLREGDFTIGQHRDTILRLNEDWKTYSLLPVSNAVAYHAGDLAEWYALRGYDAIHLASAVRLVETAENAHFLAFDIRLADAARRANVPVYGEN